MSDGYFGIYIKSKYEEFLSGLVSGVYKDFKLFTDFGEGVQADVLIKSSTIEEIYEQDKLFRSGWTL